MPGIKEIDGDYWIFNFSEANGTLLNGEQIEKTPLADGDLIQIGPFFLYPNIRAMKGSATGGRDERSARCRSRRRASSQMSLPSEQRKTMSLDREHGPFERSGAASARKADAERDAAVDRDGDAHRAADAAGRTGVEDLLGQAQARGRQTRRGFAAQAEAKRGSARRSSTGIRRATCSSPGRPLSSSGARSS